MKRSKGKLAFIFCLLILVIAGITWSVYRARLAQEQADFLASVASSGGSVVMDYEADGGPPPRLPLWFRGIGGDWPYAHVVKVKTSNLDQLPVVGEFAQMRDLDCSSCAAGVSGQLKFLRRCEHLRILNLADGSPELEHLADFRELEVLDLSDASLSPDQLASFKHMPALRTLRLGETGIDDKGIRRLRFLKQLEELDLHKHRSVGLGLRLSTE